MRATSGLGGGDDTARKARPGALLAAAKALARPAKTTVLVSSTSVVMMVNRVSVLAAMLAMGCYADANDGGLGDSADELDEADAIVENLKLAGFPEQDIWVHDDGTVVVGHDAVVSLQASRELAGLTADGDGDELRQYRTTNIVNTAQFQNICIDGSALAANLTLSEGLAAAISNYNDQSLSFTLTQTNGAAAGCDAVITTNLTTGTSASAGFPLFGGPYLTINIGSGVANYGTQVATHVITHEIGHCIGFRHSDYYDRSISCGGSADNEGSGFWGANHIGGTPTTAVLNGSVMNSCYNIGSTGVWTSSDIAALDCLYGSGACGALPLPPAEVCDNGIDDDGDGATDCADDDCAADPACGPACGDGVCEVGESCDGRNGTSECLVDCPGVTNGRPSNRYCFVDGVCEGPGC